MSVIRKKPYIESVLDSMSAEKKAELKTILNTGGNNVSLDFSGLVAATYKNKSTPVYFKLDETNAKTGILIWNNTYCTLVCYHRFQDLAIYEIDPSKHTYQKINEYCDINELRRVVDEYIESSGDEWVDKMKNEIIYNDETNTIEAGGNFEIDGTLQVNEKVTAPLVETDVLKIGGVEFHPSEEITADLLNVELTEDTAIDQDDVNSLLAAINCSVSYDDKTYYKVANYQNDDYMVFANFARINGDWVGDTITVDTVDGTWEKNSGQFALTNGYYSTMSVGTANQLLATIGNEDSVPYLYRTSGGSVSIGDRVNEEIVGGSVAFNQLVENGNFESTSGWTVAGGTLAVSSNVATYTLSSVGTAWYSNNIQREINVIPRNHKVLLCVNIKPKYTTSMFYALREGTTYRFANGSQSMVANTWNTLARIVDTGSYDIDKVVIGFNTIDGSWTIGDTIQVKNVMAIDITQMYGPTIADYWYGLSNNGGVAKFKEQFPNDYYAYNTGALKHVNVLSKKVVRFNQWDEEIEVAEWDGATIKSKNKIYVIPNRSYYFKAPKTLEISIFNGQNNLIDTLYPNDTNGRLIVMPSNASYIKMMANAYGTTYNHDICINISWSGARNGEYQPYEEHTYAMPSGDLYGIPKLDANNELYYDGDIYKADGSINRKYGIVDLGSFTWEYNGYYMQATNALPLAKGGTDVPANAVCAIYTIYPSNHLEKGLAIGSTTKTVFVNGSGYTNAAEFKAAMSGVELLYELATPTTEQGTPYQNPQIVDDWGTEEFITDDSIVPVGHNSVYAANLRDKLQNLPANADSNGLYLVKQTGAQQSLEAYSEPENPYVLKTLTLTDGVSTETFTGFVHCVMELETSGLHYCTQFDLAPYNASEAINQFYIANGYGTAYIGDDGTITIALPSGVTGTIVVKYYEYEVE